MDFFRWSLKELRQKNPEQYKGRGSVITRLKDCLLQETWNKLDNLTEKYKENIHILFLYYAISDLPKEIFTKFDNINNEEDMAEYILNIIGKERLETLNTIMYKSKLNSLGTIFANIKTFYDSTYGNYDTDNVHNLHEKIDLLTSLEKQWLSGDRFFELLTASHITAEHITLLWKNIITLDEQLLLAILFGHWTNSRTSMRNYPKWPIDHIKLLWDDIYTLTGDKILDIYHYLSPEIMNMIHTSGYKLEIYNYKNTFNSEKMITTNINRLIFIPLPILQQYIIDLEKHWDIKEFFDCIEAYIETHQKKILSDRQLYHIQENFSQKRKNIGLLDDNTLQSLVHIYEENSQAFIGVTKAEEFYDIEFIECLDSNDVKGLYPMEIHSHVVWIALAGLEKLSQEDFSQLNSSWWTKKEKILELYKKSPSKKIDKDEENRILSKCFQSLSLEQLYTIKTKNLKKIDNDNLEYISKLSIDEINSIWIEELPYISCKDFRLRLFSRI